MEYRYFDEGLLRLRFFDPRRALGETNSVLVSDATDKLFYILLSHSEEEKPFSHHKSKWTVSSRRTRESSKNRQCLQHQKFRKVITTKTHQSSNRPAVGLYMPDVFLSTRSATIPIMPCGHICSGSCLFAAVKTGIQRSGMEHYPGGSRAGGASGAVCPLFRSVHSCDP